MKIRTDFVTNSSSSSFVLMLKIKLKNGTEHGFGGVGSCGEGSMGDFYELNVSVSPRELGNANSVEALIEMLKEGVKDGKCKIFDKQDPNRQRELARLEKLGCQDLIKNYGQAGAFIEALSCISDVDEISSISITGNEYGQPYNYLRTFTYDCVTGDYTFEGKGMDFEKNGGSGGDLCFRDAHLANMFQLTDVDFINFNGRTFVVTGFSEKRKRELKNIIEGKGGFLSETITQKVQYLIVNTGYGHPTRKYNDAKAMNEDAWAWLPNNIAIIDEATFLHFAALPSGQVRSGGSPLRYSMERSRKELVDVSHTATEVTVTDDEEIYILQSAFVGIEALESITLGPNVILCTDISFRVKRAVLGHIKQLTKITSYEIPYIEMPVDLIDECKSSADKIYAVRNYIRKRNAGEDVTTAIVASYHAYMKRQRKMLCELPDGLDIIWYLAKNALLTKQDSVVLLQRADIQEDAQLCDLLSAPPKPAERPKAASQDKFWLKHTKELRVYDPEASEYTYRMMKTARLYKGIETEVVVPGEIKGDPISVLGELALSPYAEGLTPEQVEARKNLKRVTVSEEIRYVHASAFRGCENLVELILPNGIVEIFGDRNEKAVQLFDIASDVQKKQLCSCIGAFSCNRFVNDQLEIPEGIEVIGQGTFKSAKCKRIVMPESVRFIGGGAFYDCENLEEITLHRGIENVEDSAFCGCKKLQRVVFEEGFKEIGTSMFKYCSSLSTVVIPSSVKVVSKEAFHGCANLESVTLNNGLERIEKNAFGFNKKLSEISIPGSVRSIGEDAFHLCENLSKVDLHEGLMSIERCAFAHCANLHEIRIPKSVQDIHQHAFARKIKDLTVYAKSGSYAEKRMKELGYCVIAE